MVAKKWAALNVLRFKEKDKELRQAYDLVCTAQLQDDPLFKRVDIPVLPGVEVQHKYWLRAYMQCVYGKQNSVNRL